MSVSHKRDHKLNIGRVCQWVYPKRLQVSLIHCGWRVRSFVEGDAYWLSHGCQRHGKSFKLWSYRASSYASTDSFPKFQRDLATKLLIGHQKFRVKSETNHLYHHGEYGDGRDGTVHPAKNSMDLCLFHVFLLVLCFCVCLLCVCHGFVRSRLQ